MNSAKVYLMQPVMQKQEDPFNLRGLPSVEPPRDGWPAIEAALRQDRRRRTNWRYAGAALAAAATVTLALGLSLRQPLPTPAEQPLTQAQPAAQQELIGATGADSASPTDTLDSVITLSQRLERRLRDIRAGVGDLPASAVVYQVELEDLIVQVDEELSTQPDSLALWSRRVDLLIDLERLYANSLRRDYQQMASL
jgi:hypothetical protein